MTQYDPLFDISNKTVIVTGASSGLGVTFAKFLAERGANVAITARRVEKLNDLNPVETAVEVVQHPDRTPSIVHLVRGQVKSDKSSNHFWVR